MSYAQYCRLGCHVGDSNRTVIRAAHRLLSKVSRRAAGCRGMRHRWLRLILQYHQSARDLHRMVTRGRL